jgi:hypothetical protein
LMRNIISICHWHFSFHLSQLQNTVRNGSRGFILIITI